MLPPTWFPATGDVTPRRFLARALSFVQCIPYASLDGGLKRPLALLSCLAGNCGSKTTLLLALFSAAYPAGETRVVCVPAHVFGGAAVEIQSGDTVIDGKFVAVEPVGPSQLPVGRLRPSR